MPKSIRSHLAAIKRLHAENGLQFSTCQQFSIQAHLAGIDRSLAYHVKQAPSINPEQLELLIKHLCKKPGHQPFVFALTLAFTTFIRQANLAPTSDNFDRLKHTTRRDIISTKSGLGLVVFWTKTRQTARSPDIIPIPNLKDTIICPTKSWQKYQEYTRGAPLDGPLLVTPTNNYSTMPGNRATFRTITLSFLRQVLALAIDQVGLDKNITLHSFRRGGSLLCYKEGASLPDVMLHGTWTTDAVWTYLAKETAWSSSVMTAWENLSKKRAERPDPSMPT